MGHRVRDQGSETRNNFQKRKKTSIMDHSVIKWESHPERICTLKADLPGLGHNDSVPGCCPITHLFTPTWSLPKRLCLAGPLSWAACKAWSPRPLGWPSQRRCKREKTNSVVNLTLGFKGYSGALNKERISTGLTHITGLWSHWIQTLVLPTISLMTTDKSLNHAVPQFPHL